MAGQESRPGITEDLGITGGKKTTGGPGASGSKGIIDGRAIAAALTERTAASAALLREKGVTPALAVVVPNDDEGAARYVRSIGRVAAKAGIECLVHPLPLPAGQAEISRRLAELSGDPAIHGVICQTPLPPGADLAVIGSSITVSKDVDGANPESAGRVATGVPGAFPPATAAAVVEILAREQVPIAGRRAVVVGRSNIVGKPAALLLLARHATVTICHSRTRNLPQVCQEADILVAAAGRPKLIGADYVAPGAVVIDVGINPVDGALVGDVDTDRVLGVASAITPVPGGVGPVTTAQLMRHTIRAALRANSMDDPG
jgi:methylenetetrahydrofolate dehydrogenase (NADP+) / methenyltetrahydrofolate cyclohydrolase